MKKEIFIENLQTFIQKGTCAFTCVDSIKKRLQEYNFEEMSEYKNWKKLPNTFFITRNDSSLIAVKIPENFSESFHIITTHLDTPALLLKPNGVFLKENYLQYNVMPYGGLLNYGWIDKPLSLAGRILFKKKDTWQVKIVDFKDTVAVIPSVAVHQNDKANSNLDLNMQTDLQPIFFLSEAQNDWDAFLRKYIKITKEEKIGDYELFLYDNSLPIVFGKNEEFLLSPRIDNLTSVYASLESFLESKPSTISIFCSFNNEEIGSLTKEGADSNFLLDTLKRIAASLQIDISETLANSWIISSDNTHALHPNHDEYADVTSKGLLGKGFAIVKEINSTTDAIFSSLLKDLCKKKKIAFQDVTAKNDLVGGSTLSGLSLRHVSVSSIDVGVVQLAMHSSKELCATEDVFSLYKMMLEFYNSEIIRKKETFQLY